MTLRTPAVLTSGAAAALLLGLLQAPAAQAADRPQPTGARSLDNVLCIYSTEITDRTTGGYVWDIGKRAHALWKSDDFQNKYGELSYAEQTNKLLYELNVSQHVFGHSWLVHFTTGGKLHRKLDSGEEARYDTYSFQPNDPDGTNGDGSPVDGMSVNYTGYDINVPGKPLVEWDRPSRKQDQGQAHSARAARCTALTGAQQSAFKQEIQRRTELNEKYTLLPSWNFLLTGGWAGTPARNCTTFALQVWDATMKDTPAERIDAPGGYPAADINELGGKVPADLTQSEFSAWIPALAGKWIREKNGGHDESAEVPRFADDALAPAGAR
ncbi:hypothetical protein [Streptomyces chrestomyceticus]|uniref:Secreted protein n=1 Tax=Streptomyces chrestomyceticus TaxID=68185 RepID=A0ABU7X191_9ACTN